VDLRQAISHPHGVTVFGSAQVRAEPDRAVLRFAAEYIAETPGDSFAHTNAAVARLRALLAREGIADADVNTSRVTLEQTFAGYADTRRFLGFTSAVAFDVVVDALDRVEDLLVALVEHGASSVAGVSYETRRLAELRAEARRLAVAAARRKAELYASAAGVRLGPVTHIEDVNPERMKARTHGAELDLVEPDEATGASSGSILVSGAVLLSLAILR
jgi:uncharacterized protein YggE